MTGILRAHEAAAWLRHTAQIWQFGIPGTEFAAHPATHTESAIRPQAAQAQRHFP